MDQIEEIAFQMDNFPADIEKARLDHIKVLQATKGFYKAIVVLVVLTLTEVPAWCHQDKAEHLTAYSFVPGSDWCRPPGENDNMYLSGIWYLPPAVALVVEVFVEVVILRRFWLEYNFENEHFATLGERPGAFKYSNLANIYAGVICSVGSILDTAIFSFFKVPFRFTFVFRTGLLCLLPGFQRLYKRIFNQRMIGQLVSVAWFFIGTVLFFAWIMVTVYKDMDFFAYKLKGEEILVNKGFDSLRSSIYTMFLAGMTEGFSDIFLPTITSNRLAAILWILYLLLTQVLFLNLVIDAFVAAYLESSEEQMAVTAQAEAKALWHSSQLLFSGEEMEKEIFLKFIAEISESPRMRPIPPKLADVIYDSFKEKYGGVTRESFCNVCSLVQNPMWIAPRNSFLENSAVWNNPTFISTVRENVWPEGGMPTQYTDQDAHFDVIMDWVLIFNMIYIVVESLPQKDKWIVPQFLHLSTFFTIIYVFEVAVKLSVKSWRTYWSDKSNQFDFYTTWLLFLAWTLQFVHIQELQRDLMRYANIIRLLRLLRVAKKLQKNRKVQFMVSTIVKMLEGAADILTLLGVCLYFFATFSVNFFGGLLYEGNPALEGSDYKEKHWFVFNFNDVPMGYTTWFTQLLCEYAPEWADALTRTSRHGEIAWFIYPIFYIIGVAIVFEILKAFTIETYLALKEEHIEGEKKKAKKEKKKALAAIEQGEVTPEAAEAAKKRKSSGFLAALLPQNEEGSESSSSESESEEEEDTEKLMHAFDAEDDVIAKVHALLKKENRSLHKRRALLPKLQVQIKEAYEKALHKADEETKED